MTWRDSRFEGGRLPEIDADPYDGKSFSMLTAAEGGDSLLPAAVQIGPANIAPGGAQDGGSLEIESLSGISGAASGPAGPIYNFLRGPGGSGSGGEWWPAPLPFDQDQSKTGAAIAKAKNPFANYSPPAFAEFYKQGKEGNLLRNPFWKAENTVIALLDAQIGPNLTNLNCNQLLVELEKLQGILMQAFAVEVAAQCAVWQASLTNEQAAYLLHLEKRCLEENNKWTLKQMLSEFCGSLSDGACLYLAFGYITSSLQPPDPFILAFQKSCLAQQLASDLSLDSTGALQALLKSYLPKLEVCVWAEKPDAYFFGLGAEVVQKALGLYNSNFPEFAISNGDAIGGVWVRLNNVLSLMILSGCKLLSPSKATPAKLSQIFPLENCYNAIAQLGGGPGSSGAANLAAALKAVSSAFPFAGCAAYV